MIWPNLSIRSLSLEGQGAGKEEKEYVPFLESPTCYCSNCNFTLWNPSKKYEMKCTKGPIQLFKAVFVFH